MNVAEHTYASAIVGAQKNYARKPADFYPTPPDVTHALLDFLQLPAGTTAWEPACGDGAMSCVLEARGFKVRSTDLREDSGYGVGGVDFLAQAPTPETRCDWVISNPPFKHAVDFIRCALSHAPNAAMLLKSQFWHAQGRLSLFEELSPEWILPLTWRPSFLEKERGNSPLMDVIWVVWMNGTTTTGTKFRPIRRPIGDKRLRKITDLRTDDLW